MALALVVVLVVVAAIPGGIAITALLILRGQSALSTPPKDLSTAQGDFHKAEFVALKAEVAEYLKSSAANFQTAVVASGGIFTWLVTASHAHGATPVIPVDECYLKFGFLLPLAFASLLFWLSLAAYVRIHEIGRYLRCIEDTIGHKSLGWEKHFLKRPAMFGPLFFTAWLILLAGDGLLALLLPLTS